MISMNTNYLLAAHSVHLWRVFVPDMLAEINHLRHLLNEEEMVRAERLHFEEHRSRYIIARAMLRQILSLYTQQKAEEIVFLYGPRGKPFLRDNPLNIHFNVSHSHDMAVYALTLGHEIGIDIEKIKDQINLAVAKRFFSPEEYDQLNSLPETEQKVAFYFIWAAKEAFIKALGEGLFAPLADFTIDIKQQHQIVKLATVPFYVESFIIHPDYQSAFATPQPIESVIHWQWSTNGITSP